MNESGDSLRAVRAPRYLLPGPPRLNWLTEGAMCVSLQTFKRPSGSSEDELKTDLHLYNYEKSSGDKMWRQRNEAHAHEENTSCQDEKMMKSQEA